MGIVKVNRQVDALVPNYDPDGALTGLTVVSTVSLKDDVANQILARPQSSTNVWNQLTPVQQTQLQAILTRLTALVP